MRRSEILGMAAGLTLAMGLGACDRGRSAATNERDSAVTVNGDAVSRADLQQEAQGAGAAADDLQAQQALLPQVVNRKLLAQTAEADKLDETPAFQAAERRAREAALAEALLDKLAGPKPSAAAISSFVAQNPKMFGEREALSLDQIQADARAVDGSWLQPARSIADAARILTEHKVPFERGTGTADTAAMPPQLLQILADKPQEPFATPVGSKIVISQVTRRQKVPVPADQIDALAAAELRRRTVQKALSDKLAELRGKAKITYGAGFTAPPAAPPATAR